MRILRLLIWVAVILSAHLTSAQQLNADSLKRLLNTAKEDTTQVLLFSRLEQSYQFSNPDSALSYALQGLKLAEKVHYVKGELYCRESLAGYWWSIGDYATAIKLLLPKLNSIESTNDPDLVVTAFAFLSNSYRDQGDYTEALHYFVRASNFLEHSYHCLGYCRINNAGIADIYLLKNKLDSAQFYLNKAFSYQPDPGLSGWVYLVAGRIYAARHVYDSALLNYQQSMAILTKENNLKDLAGALNYMAALFRKTGHMDSAVFYAHKSLQIAKQRKFALEAMDASLLLSESYETSKTDSALHYYKQAMAAKDSLYNQEKQRQILSYKFNEQWQQQEAENAQALYKNQVRLYLLLAAAGIFLIIAFLLWRNNQHKKKTNLLLQGQKEKVEQTLQKLKATQAQLIQSEKMASLGELTAGIAHEIQNPLNFVNNFSETNMELLGELNQELDAGAIQEAKLIAIDVIENEQKINFHGKRADSIVKAMLEHSRTSKGEKQPTAVNALASEYLRLAYHGFRAKDKNFNAKVEADFDEGIEKLNIVPQEIGRVLLNLFNNAFYEVNEKKKQMNAGYEPSVSVSTKKLKDKIEILVRDNGMGISKEIIDKIFQPFFTTKPTGQGTGLGLSLSYDIIRAYGGELKVESKEGEGTMFTILLFSN